MVDQRDEYEPLIPEVWASLENATRPLIAQRPHRRRFRSRVGVLGLGTVLISGTAWAAATWNPTLGSDDSGHPPVSTMVISPSEVAALGVLRRPQGPADRGDRVTSMLERLGTHYESGVHVDQVRMIPVTEGDYIVLVPVDRGGYDGDAGASALRPNQLCMVYAFTVSAAEAGPDYDGGYDNANKCGSLVDLKAGRLVMGAPRGGIYTGLVPDGVSRVQATSADGAVVTADVHDNGFQLRAPNSGAFNNSDAITWLNEQGADVPK